MIVVNCVMFFFVVAIGVRPFAKGSRMHTVAFKFAVQAHRPALGSTHIAPCQLPLIVITSDMSQRCTYRRHVLDMLCYLLAWKGPRDPET